MCLQVGVCADVLGVSGDYVCMNILWYICAHQLSLLWVYVVCIMWCVCVVRVCVICCSLWCMACKCDLCCVWYVSVFILWMCINMYLWYVMCGTVHVACVVCVCMYMCCVTCVLCVWVWDRFPLVSESSGRERRDGTQRLTQARSSHQHFLSEPQRLKCCFQAKFNLGFQGFIPEWIQAPYMTQRYVNRGFSGIPRVLIWLVFKSRSIHCWSWDLTNPCKVPASEQDSLGVSWKETALEWIG